MEPIIAAAMKTDYLRSFEESLVIKEYISKHDIGKTVLSEVLTGQLNDICRTISFASYEADSFIYCEGDPADSMFVVLTGDVNITNGFSIDLGQGKKESRQRVIRECSQGAHFGEEIASSDDPRCNSAVCVTKAQLLVIKKAVYRSIVSSGTFKDEQASGNVKKGSKEHIMNILSKPRKNRTDVDVEALTSYLEREIPFFKTFATDQILELSRVVEGARFADKQLLCREGSVGMAFFIVVSGHVTIYELQKPKVHQMEVEMGVLRKQISFNSRSGISTPSSSRHRHPQKQGAESSRPVSVAAAGGGGPLQHSPTLSFVEEESSVAPLGRGGSPSSPTSASAAVTQKQQQQQHSDVGRVYRTIEDIQHCVNAADFGDRVNTLGVGKGFGERALESVASMRMGTVTTGEESTELLIISKTDYLNLISVIRNTLVMEKISLLRKTNLFKSTDVVFLRSIAKIMNPVKYSIDDVLYRSGQKVQHMTILSTGEAQVEVDVEVQARSKEKIDYTRLAQPFKRWTTTKFVPTDTPSRSNSPPTGGLHSQEEQKINPLVKSQSLGSSVGFHDKGGKEKRRLEFYDPMVHVQYDDRDDQDASTAGTTHLPFATGTMAGFGGDDGQNEEERPRVGSSGAGSARGRLMRVNSVKQRLASVMKLGRVGPGAVLAAPLTLGSMTELHENDIFHTETVTATTSITGFTISRNDFFYHLEYDTRTMIADIVRGKIQNPSQLPHLWDDAPKVLTDTDWRRRQAWNLFRSDLVSKDASHKKDIVGTFRSLSNCKLITDRYGESSGMHSGATVASELSADAVLFGTDDPTGKAVIMKRFGPSPIVEQVRKNQQKGSAYVLDIIKTNHDRITHAKHNLVFFPDANQPSTPGLAIRPASPLKTSPTMTAEASVTTTTTDGEHEEDWIDDMSETEMDGRALTIANSILNKAKTSTQAKASSYVKDALDPDRQQSRILKFPFALIHIHREQMVQQPQHASDDSETAVVANPSKGKGGLRRSMRCHMRICGLMKTSLAAKECAASQMKNVFYTSLSGDYRKERELKLEWKSFSGFEGMPLQHTDHFIVYCRSAPLESASLTPSVDLLKQVYPSGCRIKDQSYVCFTTRSLSNLPQAASDPVLLPTLRGVSSPTSLGVGGSILGGSDNGGGGGSRRWMKRGGGDDDTDSDDSSHLDMKGLGAELRSITIVTTGGNEYSSKQKANSKLVQPMFLLEVSALCEVVAAAPSRADCLKFAFSDPDMLSRADPQVARLLAAGFVDPGRPDSPGNNSVGYSPINAAVGRIGSPRSMNSRAQSPAAGGLASGFAPVVSELGNLGPSISPMPGNAQQLSILGGSTSQVISGGSLSSSSGVRTCITPLYEWFLVNEETLKNFDVINSTSKAFAMKAEAAKDTTSMDAQILEQKKDAQMRRSLHEAGLLADKDSPPLNKKLGTGNSSKLAVTSLFRSKEMTGNERVDEKIVASIAMKSLEQDVARRHIQKEVDRQLAGKLAGAAAAAANQRSASSRNNSPKQQQQLDQRLGQGGQGQRQGQGGQGQGGQGQGGQGRGGQGQQGGGGLGPSISSGLLSPTGFLASISSSSAVSGAGTTKKKKLSFAAPAAATGVSLDLNKKSAGMLVAEERIVVLKAVMETRKKALEAHSSLCSNEKNGLPDKNGREALLARLSEKKRQAQLEALAASSAAGYSVTKLMSMKTKSGTVESDSDVSDPDDDGKSSPPSPSNKLSSSLDSLAEAKGGTGTEEFPVIVPVVEEDSRARLEARRRENTFAKQLKAKQDERERQKNLKPRGLDMDPTFLSQRAELFETLCGLPSRDSVEQAVRTRLVQQVNGGGAPAISSNNKQMAAAMTASMSTKGQQTSRTQAAAGGAKITRQVSFGVAANSAAATAAGGGAGAGGGATTYESAMTTNLLQTSVNMAYTSIRSTRKATSSNSNGNGGNGNNNVGSGGAAPSARGAAQSNSGGFGSGAKGGGGPGAVAADGSRATVTSSSFAELPMTEKLAIKLDILGEMLQKPNHLHFGVTI